MTASVGDRSARRRPYPAGQRAEWVGWLRTRRKGGAAARAGQARSGWIGAPRKSITQVQASTPGGMSWTARSNSCARARRPRPGARGRRCSSLSKACTHTPCAPQGTPTHAEHVLRRAVGRGVLNEDVGREEDRPALARAAAHTRCTRGTRCTPGQAGLPSLRCGQETRACRAGRGRSGACSASGRSWHMPRTPAARAAPSSAIELSRPVCSTQCSVDARQHNTHARQHAT